MKFELRVTMAVFAVLFVWVLSYSSLSLAALDKKPVVFVLTAETIELSEVLAYPARVEPRIRAAVVAETDGVVTRILAPLGSQVKAKSSLLMIKNTDPVYSYAPLVVTSAVAGVVSRVEVTEGSRVSRGDKLLLVTDPEQVRIAVEVTAQDLKYISPGQKAELKTQSSVESIPLRVKGVSPFVDPATGTASCELELDRNAQGGRAPGTKGSVAPSLPPLGILGRVYFRANVRKGISVPDSAITYRGKDPFIRIVESGKAKLMAVDIGRKESGQVEILKGLKSGDSFVERASGFVADGEEVEIKMNEKNEGKENKSKDKKSDSTNKTKS